MTPRVVVSRPRRALECASVLNNSNMRQHLSIRLRQAKGWKQTWALKSGLKVIYSTGYSPDSPDTAAPPANFLQKPYPPEMLTRTVRACLDAA